MQSYKIFVIIAPGLEELAAKEIALKCPIAPLTMTKGGIELEADLHWIERAHTLLKVPTRLLLRMTEFKAKDFPTLFKKMSQFSWNLFLSHPNPEWSISSSSSRLIHTGRIEETLQSALQEAQKRQPLSLDWQKKNYSPQTFYVRLQDDILTLSLDLTGEPLYKRGLQKIKGEAPLRENFAAALVMDIFEGIHGQVTLVDPMCGSGTFLTEALTFHRPLHRRPFAFETAPFSKGRTLKLPPEGPPLPIMEAIGIDLNGELLKKVEKEIQEKLPLRFASFDSTKNPLPSTSEMIMLCNPPYGERIKIEGQRGSFLRTAWKKFLEQDRPLRFGWILPSDMDDLFEKAPGYKLRVKRHLKNGGLAVTFWIWERA